MKLRLPAAVPTMVPGMKLAATAAVIGVIVSEISTGVRGIGFASLTYGQKATSDPAQLYTAVFGVGIWYLLKMMHAAPHPHEEPLEADAHAPIRTAGPPPEFAT